MSESKASSKCFSQLRAARALVSSSSQIARAGDAERHVGRVRRDLVRDAALLHVVLLGQPEVLFGSDVAEHRRAVERGGGRADRSS